MMHTNTSSLIGRFARRLALAATFASACGGSAWATTYTVGAGKYFATPEHIAWSSIHPGDTVVIYPGTYTTQLGTGNSMLLNGVKGTAAQPITIEGSSAASLPVLDAGVLITGGTEYVKITNLVVTRPTSQTYAAIVVTGNSSNVVLSGLTVHDSFTGVEFLTPGLANTLENSQIYSNSQEGVTAGPPNTASSPNASKRSYLTANAIHDNGSHGVEITGPYWVVEHNRVTHNGLSVHGTSGIHIFNRTDVVSAYGCNDNQVSYNYVTAQQDADGVDGNGIQIEDFCNSNTVSFNVVWANAGAGISVLDAENNIVVANTTYANATDTGRVAKYPGVFRGEIILGSMANLCSNPNITASACHVKAGASSGNKVYDNIVVSGQADVPGIMVSPDAANDNTNYIYLNWYHNRASSTTGLALLWAQEPYYTANTINAVTGQSKRGGGNIVAAPSFVNAASPGTDGLKLATKPENEGWVVAPTQPDMSGALPSAGVAYYGAYYK